MSHLKLLFILSFLLILVACKGGQIPKSDSYNVGTITLKAGESASCFAIDVCAVYLVMPEASGQYVVNENGPGGKRASGTFSALGQVVLLGQFYEGRTKFTIEGLDVPDTWVTVVAH